MNDFAYSQKTWRTQLFSSLFACQKTQKTQETVIGR